MCSHLVRAMLSAAGGKAHLWRSHGVWTCAWRSFTGRGATPALAWADADEKAHHRLGRAQQ